MSYNIGFMFSVFGNVQHVNYFIYYLKVIKCSCFTLNVLLLGKKKVGSSYSCLFSLSSANGPAPYTNHYSIRFEHFIFQKTDIDSGLKVPTEIAGNVIKFSFCSLPVVIIRILSCPYQLVDGRQCPMSMYIQGETSLQRLIWM